MRFRLDPRRSFRPHLEALETRALLSVCTVDRLTDLGQGTGLAGDLRYCITQAQDGDTIGFSVTGTIQLTHFQLYISRSITIQGPGPQLLTVRQNGRGQVFVVEGGANALISGLIITGGSNDVGGGGLENIGNLVLFNVTVTGNSTNSRQFWNATGGGICNYGTVTLIDSKVTDNYASSDYDQAAYGGGIYNRGTLVVINSTVSNNEVGALGTLGGGGGGIYNDGYLGRATTIILGSTISGNLAYFGREGWVAGGGVFSDAGTLRIDGSTITRNEAKGGGAGGINAVAGATVSLRDTIIAGNAAANSPDLFGHLTSSGHNLIGNTQGGSGFVATDLLNVNPQLGPLQDNGGPTLTHALLPGSLAIDAGDNTDALEFDQRGLPRVTGNVIDIGAFEVQPGPVASFSLAAPESVLAGVPFDLSLIGYDADGYRATNYAGTVAFFSTTDPDAALPEPYTFAEADAGAVYLPESAVLFAEGLQEVGVYDVETFAEGLAYVEVFPSSAPGGIPNLPWGYGPDVAALLALLLFPEPRFRP